VKLAAPVPRVIFETTADLSFTVGVEDQQHADAISLTAGQGPREQNEPLVGQRLHERGVFPDLRLCS
jgi:hypothetical protein